MGNPVGWFEIYVDDMPRARAFYETTLGVTLQALEGTGDIAMWTFGMNQEGYGASGALVKAEGVSAGGGGTMVYFSCQDCASEQARAAAAGGTVLKPKFSIGPYGFVAIVSDTEGNCIGLHSMQ